MIVNLIVIVPFSHMSIAERIIPFDISSPRYKEHVSYNALIPLKGLDVSVDVFTYCISLSFISLESTFLDCMYIFEYLFPATCKLKTFGISIENFSPSYTSVNEIDEMFGVSFMFLTFCFCVFFIISFTYEPICK